MQSDYAGKSSHKIILPLLAERGEGRGEESKNSRTCPRVALLLTSRRCLTFKTSYASLRKT
jgi:hypothetical protein